MVLSYLDVNMFSKTDVCESLFSELVGSMDVDITIWDWIEIGGNVDCFKIFDFLIKTIGKSNFELLSSFVK